MNKTVKTILQIASYIISALLGAYGGSALMCFTFLPFPFLLFYLFTFITLPLRPHREAG